MFAPQVLKLVTAVVVASVLGTFTAAGPAAIDFVDDLTGPDSPAFRIPFDQCALSPSGLVRTSAASGTWNGVDRPVIRTASGKYLSRDFVNVSRAFTFAEFADLFDSSSAYLFLSNSSEGTTFRYASLRTP